MRAHVIPRSPAGVNMKRSLSFECSDADKCFQNRQGENSVSEIAFQKMGEVVLGTGLKLRALISLNLERNYPISSKSGHMSFLWRFGS